MDFLFSLRCIRQKQTAGLMFFIKQKLFKYGRFSGDQQLIFVETQQQNFLLCLFFTL